MGLAEFIGNVAYATLDSLEGQQVVRRRRRKKGKSASGGCTPCQAQKQIDRARKRVQKGQL